ncbi:helix-hairpin-helix domain-containing protein [Phenylobacterium sp.]|uniref:ComEA family DNA-binding protein n=1 Tax=Phenylobacterium sp. TaxID=1871053 RepID=UPI0030F3C2E4
MTDYAQISLNSSTAEELRRLPGLDEANAQAIVETRPFADWSALSRADLDQATINGLKSSGAKLGPTGEGPIGEPGSGGSAGDPAGNLGRA